MKSYILYLAVTIILSVTTAVHAQYVYDFSVSQETYMPLQNADVLNNTTIWDDVNYERNLGFNFELDWTQTKIFALVCNTKGLFLGWDTTASFNGFCVLDADLQDRGKVDTVSKSQIRYSTSIVNGKRIAKIEFYNAGFWREKDLYNTMDDSVNLQVWLYEGSNVVEFRYGPSKISHATDYFIYGSGGGPVIGFVREAGLYSLNFSEMYYLKGAPNNPGLDSCDTGINHVTTALSAYPSSGTVYRFTPQPNSIKRLNHNLDHISLRNTVCHDNLFLDNEEQLNVGYHVISLSGSVAAISGQLNHGNCRIDISTLPTGMYVLKLHSANGNSNIRFSKL